ncbi:MAG: hypothetical protein ABIF71_03580 [Planctomycetota bacterium]
MTGRPVCAGSLRLGIVTLAAAAVLACGGAGLRAAQVPSQGALPATVPADGAVRRVPLSAACDDLYLAYLEIFSMYAEDIRGRFRFEDGHVLVFEDLKADFYGGTIAGSVRVMLTRRVSYRVELDFADVDFRWLAMNLFDAGTDMKGRVKGALRISGNEDGEVHGTLDISLRDGFVRQLPRWFTMFSLVSVNPMQASIITEGMVRMNLERDRFVIRECAFDATNALIYGTGHITFGGNANIVLNVVGKHPLLSVLAPPVAALWKWVEKGVLRFSINGPLFAPQFRISPLYKL